MRDIMTKQKVVSRDSVPDLKNTEKLVVYKLIKWEMHAQKVNPEIEPDWFRVSLKSRDGGDSVNYIKHQQLAGGAKII
jgi:hypothetical protein